MPPEADNIVRLPKYVFLRSVLAMALLWCSFPPVGWSFLGWLALAPLVSVVVDRSAFGRGQSWAIWFAGLLYWLATFYFIPIPHPALWLGWITISLYLACYLPFFVFSSRTMIGRFRIPAVISIPVAWVGLELIRSYLFTGMSLVCLSHTQYLQPKIIQVSDLSGAYTLSFAMMVFVTAAYLFLIRDNKISRPSWLYLIVAAAVLTVVLGYGQTQLDRDNRRDEAPLTVALIQGSIDTTFPKTAEEARELHIIKTDQYVRLTREALASWDDIDLVIWPENGWPWPDLVPETDKSKMDPQVVRIYDESVFRTLPQLNIAGRRMPRFLVGAVSVNPVEQQQFGSAIFISQDGEVTDRYYKNHLVMFGEYVPLADWLPVLQKIPAIGKGLDSGSDSVSIDVDGKKIAPSICFETTVPQYIRNQVNKLAARDEEPDILVNVTNDGWFYGTSCLDFHLACNVFRAVEMRKPHLVCANTGLSAAIDEKGRILKRGPRRSTDKLRVQVQAVEELSSYRIIGDWIPIFFAAIAVACGVVGMFLKPLCAQQN